MGLIRQAGKLLVIDGLLATSLNCCCKCIPHLQCPQPPVEVSSLDCGSMCLCADYPDNPLLPCSCYPTYCSTTGAEWQLVVCTKGLYAVWTYVRAMCDPATGWEICGVSVPEAYVDESGILHAEVDKFVGNTINCTLHLVFGGGYSMRMTTEEKKPCNCVQRNKKVQ